MKRPQVAILMGSDSGWPTFEQAAKVLTEFRIPYEGRGLSAYRSPFQACR